MTAHRLPSRKPSPLFGWKQQLGDGQFHEQRWKLHFSGPPSQERLHSVDELPWMIGSWRMKLVEFVGLGGLDFMPIVLKLPPRFSTIELTPGKK